MQISYNPPADRGVTTLMYVGDDDALDKALSAPSKAELALGLAAIFVGIQSRGITRIAAYGYAVFVAYRANKHRAHK